MNHRQQRPAAGPGAEFRIECRAFKPFEKNTLKGFVTLRVTPPGLTVSDIQ
jgi:hypothetical protein